MTITEALKKLDALQAQILHGGRPFGDIAEAIRNHMVESPRKVTGHLARLGIYLSEYQAIRLAEAMNSENQGKL